MVAMEQKQKKWILLIEDEEYVRDLYQRELSAAGFQVDAVGTGEEGRGAIKKNPYDLVLIDILLPDINGMEILRQMKQDPATKNLRAVMLTNLGQDWMIKEGLALGAEKYLLKTGGTLEQIVKEIKELLEVKE